MPIRLSRHARLIRFPSSDRLELEGRLTPGEPGRAVILCHPHPLYGGSMLTPVVMTAERAFQEAGYTTLAFNFRGVGGSEGSHADGHAEVADVSGALRFLEHTLGHPPSIQAITGYSFGSVIGGRAAAADPQVHLYLGIAPPVNLHDFAFLQRATCRIALIRGVRDEFCDRNRLQALSASLPRPPWLRLLDTDHFFAEALEDLAGACRDVIGWAQGVRP
ncbi:MAG: alpha/beta hydrolase [Candidatus Methylomirabilia bacterium]